MKKKLIIIGGIVFVLVIAVVLFLVLNKTVYTITVSKIDDHSPDRVLTVYDDKNKKIEVKKITYMDGTLLCNGYNTTVHYGDIENEKKLKVILKDKSEVVAKIVNEEVK